MFILMKIPLKYLSVGNSQINYATSNPQNMMQPQKERGRSTALPLKNLQEIFMLKINE